MTTLLRARPQPQGGASDLQGKGDPAHPPGSTLPPAPPSTLHLSSHGFVLFTPGSESLSPGGPWSHSATLPACGRPGALRTQAHRFTARCRALALWSH